jgi:hypothetical protein
VGCRTVPLPPNHCHSCVPCVSGCIFFVVNRRPLPPIFLIRSSLIQHCHYHTPTGTIRTVLIPSIQRYHCHPTTATRVSPVPLYALFLSSATLPLPLFKRIVSRSILPLPHSNRYHSNRLVTLYPTVPLPPNHCHLLIHCPPICARSRQQVRPDR